jgi:hypothetical protein
MLAHELRNPLGMPMRAALEGARTPEGNLPLGADVIERDGRLARIVETCSTSRASPGQIILRSEPSCPCPPRRPAFETARPLIDGRQQFTSSVPSSRSG